MTWTNVVLPVYRSPQNKHKHVSQLQQRPTDSRIRHGHWKLALEVDLVRLQSGTGLAGSASAGGCWSAAGLSLDATNFYKPKLLILYP